MGMTTETFWLAYVDPFSGTILLQLLIAGAVGGMAFCRKWFYRIARLVIGKSKKDPSD